MKADIWFDFDGTIIKVENRFYRVYVQVCKELGLETLTQSEYWQSRCEGIPTMQILARTGSESVFDNFIERRNALIEDPIFLEMDELRLEAPDVLEQLLSLGYKLYLISGRAFKANLLSQMEKLFINNFFQAVYTVSPYGGWKEKSGILRLHSVKVSMIIGDSAADVLAGKDAGLRTCAIRGGMSTDKKIEEICPDYTIRELGEIISLVRQ